jgi:dihydrofolate reductase
MVKQSRVIVYIAVSLDGFIAKQDGDIDWLSIVNSPLEDYGYGAFIKNIDTVIMGRKSYDKICSLGVEFPHKDKRCYVLSRTQHTSNNNNMLFYQGNVTSLLEEIKSNTKKNIYVEGGAQVIDELRRNDLIDEYIISIIPILLGRGISLFKESEVEETLKLINTQSYSSGLVQVHYQTQYK